MAAAGPPAPGYARDREHLRSQQRASCAGHRGRGGAGIRPHLQARFAESAQQILADLVRAGAALGWVEPPSRADVAELLGHVVRAVRAGDGSLRAAYLDRRLVGLGYWLRYARPTHRPHADLEKIAVDGAAQGRGVGRALTAALIADARRSGIEVLTLDARGDNSSALHLYRSLGFTEYGRLPDFVAVGERRFDKVFYMLDLRRQRLTPRTPEGCRAS
ncbi:GNAT family N-acetyltransferase [Micromonospora sp. CB01531]|uniref:GNAT family N-acetyltransferase n=1 Tax=Micromonospora sp. CB01531 TaxID=1718947 RepID=UPI000B18A309|nr:N-acetyltransferase [Micromonospora sp. CB01531]